MDNDAILFIFPVVNHKAIWAIVFIHMNIAFNVQVLRHLLTTMLLPCIHIQIDVSFGSAAYRILNHYYLGYQNIQHAVKYARAVSRLFEGLWRM
jgi:hypothetical protein